MIMAKVLRSILFSSIILLAATPAPSSSQLPPAPLSMVEPLGSTPPALLSVEEPLGSTPPALLSAEEPLGSMPPVLLSAVEPLRSTPPALLSAAELLRSTTQTAPAPSPGALSGVGFAERVTASEFDELDVETIGFLTGFDGKQKAGAALMLLGGSGLLVYGWWVLREKVRPGSPRRRRFGSLGQPRKFWMG